MIPNIETIAPPVIEWKVISEKEFVFRNKQYTLRVEQKKESHWSWCVYFKDNYIGHDNPMVKTKTEAIIHAESCFVKHWRNNPKNIAK